MGRTGSGGNGTFPYWALLLMVIVGGCAHHEPVRTASRTQPPAVEAPVVSPRTVRPPVASVEPPPRPSPESASIGDEDELRPVPDIILELLPGQDELTEASVEKLAGLIRELQSGGQGLIRMEAYAPRSGSNALGIGIANGAITALHRQLIRHKAPLRRIVIANFGEVASAERYSDRAWIEVHWVDGRPGENSVR